MANALARLDILPAAAILLLIECSADTKDELRLNAAMALKRAAGGEVAEVMKHLVADANMRIRLIAASSILTGEPNDAMARTVLLEALGDANARVRKAALEVIESLGTEGFAFLGDLKQRHELEEDAESRNALITLIERLGHQPGAKPQAMAD